MSYVPNSLSESELSDIRVAFEAVKLTKTDMDDQLLEVVTKAIAAREGE